VRFFIAKKSLSHKDTAIWQETKRFFIFHFENNILPHFLFFKQDKNK